MAVVTLKSTQITNRDSVPSVITNAAIGNGVLKEAFGYVIANNGDSIGSKYVIAQVPSNARLSEIKLFCDAITAGAANIGVSRNTADGAAVVSAALFASAQSIAAAVSGTDVTNQSGTYTLDKQEQPLWQAAGLTADPVALLDIVVTLTAATTATGKIGLKVRYT